MNDFLYALYILGYSIVYPFTLLGLSPMALIVGGVCVFGAYYLGRRSVRVE